MKRFLFVLIIVMLPVLSGCMEKFDSDAEKAAIEKVLDKMILANETEDIEMLGEVFLQDKALLNIGLGKEDFLVGWEKFRETMEEQFLYLEDVKIKRKATRIRVHPSGKSAHFYFGVDYFAKVHKYELEMNNVRYTGVLEKHGPDWKIVQAHMSTAIDNEVSMNESKTEDTEIKEANIEE